MSENWYDRHVLPWMIDWACGLPLFQRQLLISPALGRVPSVTWHSHHPKRTRGVGA